MSSVEGNAASPPPPSDEQDLEGLLGRSRQFVKQNVPFPTRNNLTSTLLEGGADPKRLLDNANRAYPLLHQDLITLFKDFLEFKLRSGSDIEKGIYQGMDIPQFVDRLLEKRPLMFMGANDKYLLRNCTDDRLRSGAGGFDRIGRDGAEAAPLVMRDYLTYDEVKLSALLATCSPTAAVNRGDRRNRGAATGDSGAFVRQAFIVGLVGSRLVRAGAMESMEMRVTKEQNVGGGYFGVKKSSDEDEGTLGGVFAKFYGLNHFPVYKEVEELMRSKDDAREVGGMKASDFVLVTDSNRVKRRWSSKKAKTASSPEYFNRLTYERRVRLTAETLLAEANARAAEEGKKAYVHVVGLGLGVWRMLTCQDQWYVDAFASCLSRMELPHVSDVDFSWISVPTVNGVSSGAAYPGTDVRVHLSKRDPYEPLPDGSDGKVVVSCWAYDGNSYPGNEYWQGSLASTGDSAAASCTQVVELHNPLINNRMRGNNLRVATRKGKVITWEEFLNSDQNQ